MFAPKPFDVALQALFERQNRSQSKDATSIRRRSCG